MSSIAPIEDLNAFNYEKFIENITTLFEPAPPLANALYNLRPFKTYNAVIDAAEEIIAKMSHSEKVIVVNAHPRIGAPVENLSDQSKIEQGGDEDKAVIEELRLLNQEYEKKFGFKFVVFVNGRPRKEVIQVLKDRMHNCKDLELETGLKAMILIARSRHSRLQGKL